IPPGEGRGTIAGMTTWFRMTIGIAGRQPPAQWWEPWPEVMRHVYFRREPVAIVRARRSGEARLIYYVAGGDGRIVADAVVAGAASRDFDPPQSWATEHVAPFDWRFPVRVAARCPCDESAPRYADFAGRRVSR